MLDIMYQMVFKVKILILCIVLFSCEQKLNEEKGYYLNGELKYTVPLKDELRNGELIEYYENGDVKGYSNWNKGFLDGESKLFNNDGSLNQINYYKNGVRCCESEFFNEGGFLRERQFFNEKGQLIDYFKYNNDGTQDHNIQTKVALFIPAKDSISKGEDFFAEIRLGNLSYNSIDVVLGDPTDKYILRDNPKLPKKDLKTALIEFKNPDLGLNTITGVIVEKDSSKLKRKELIIIPFEYSFYVKKQ